MYQEKKVSVVMPAYNEAASIAMTVKGFKDHPLVDEVIVADNNSSDGTGRLAEAAGARVVSELRQGYGYACRSALSAANGDFVVLTESDGSFYPDDLQILFAYLPYFDIIKGARSNRTMIEEGADWTFPLMFGNWLVAKYMQFLYFGPKIFEDVSMREVGGTYRVIKRHALERIQPYFTEGKSAFLSDMTTLAIRKGLKIIEVPVRYRRRVGISKITGNRVRAVLLGMRMSIIITKNRFKRLA